MQGEDNMAARLDVTIIDWHIQAEVDRVIFP